MGKQGPCYHCGVTSTPLWRNGPPDKPVLCNACGSRWRTKGSLVNYTPLHCRVESVIHEEHEFSQVKSMSLNKNKDDKLHNGKQNDDAIVIREVDSIQKYQEVIDEENSNRSSSGSPISDSDTQFGSTDVSDLTGPVQSVVWESVLPSRKRTCVNRSKASSVEKLTKDLRTILQEQQSSCFSSTSDEDLLLECQMPTGSMEIGHGTILIRHPSKAAQEDESEASSLCINKMSKSSLLSTPSVNTKKTKIFSAQGAGLDNSSCMKNSSYAPEFWESLSSEGHSKDYNTRRTLQERRISPADSTIAGGNSTKNPMGGKRICDTEDQVSAVKMTIKSPKRCKPSLDNKEPADGVSFLMDSFAAADVGAEQDLLLDVACAHSLRQSFFARPSDSDPNKLAISLRNHLVPYAGFLAKIHSIINRVFPNEVCSLPFLAYPWISRFASDIPRRSTAFCCL